MCTKKTKSTLEFGDESKPEISVGLPCVVDSSVGQFPLGLRTN
jgi:hypothetical protein